MTKLGKLKDLLRFIDIGANLTDSMYQGEYNGTKYHEPDLEDVFRRAKYNNVEKMIITGGNLEQSRQAVALAKQHEGTFATVGCHPTRCSEFLEDPDLYFNQLLQLIQDNPEQVVAVGEIGLDYDRTEFCSQETQALYFERQLKLCKLTGLPLFLHNRKSTDNLLDILERNSSKLSGGVVHSFDGTALERDRILEQGFYIGINGCSLKTEDNLEVVRGIPADRLLIETDCPWCEVRPSHAGFKYIKTKFEGYPTVVKKKWKVGATVKSRIEPHTIRQVFEILCGVRQEEDVLAFAEQIFANTENLFFPKPEVVEETLPEALESDLKISESNPESPMTDSEPATV